MNDHWIKAISKSGTLRAVGISATSIVRDLASRQKLTPVGTKALGEAIVGGYLLSSFLKNGERANLNIQGDGWAKQALVDAYPDGRVRGFVIENPPQDGFVITDIGPWGEGLLAVLRTKDLEKQQPYLGTVPLITGHLAKDLTYYWHQSEQVPSAVGLYGTADAHGPQNVGGFMVQAMPGASTEELKEIDHQIHELPRIAEQMQKDNSPIQMLSQIFQNTEFQILENRELRWECNCSWDRVERALMLTGADELQSIHDQEGEAVIHCDFCATEYRADRARLTGMIAKLRA